MPKSHSSYIHSPMTQAGEGQSPEPSGHVTVHGDTSTRDLPKRDVGPGSIPEVTYDHNGEAPERLSRKGAE